MQQVDPQHLLDFENQLDTQAPEAGIIPAKILAYGEMSAVLAIQGIPNMAFKRLPPFDSEPERARYQHNVERYCELLHSKLNITVLDFTFYPLTNHRGECILYLAQPCLDPEGFGNNAIASMDTDQSGQLIAAIIAYYLTNAQNSQSEPKLGIDGQLSNWHFDPAHPENPPLYIDISTPFVRDQGKEMLDAKLFLKAVPGLLSGLVKHLFLQEVLDRYYDMRMVMIDLLANLHKEQQADKIDPLMIMINDQLKQANSDIKPISRLEVDRYYQNDARIWRIFLALRKLDRFFITRILRRHYNFVLPGVIKR